MRVQTIPVKKTYAIIDIETTGGRADRDKITEIAIVLHDGERELGRFESLVNPERAIPNNITRITGITDEMVEEAPKFYEIAKKVVEMTEGAIFVAHNVRFDYGFIKSEFARLGYTYTRKQLCTVRLSRKAFPGLRSYSLGNLIKHFGIRVNDRHRAMADTLATVDLFERIMQKEESDTAVKDLVNLGVRQSKLPKNITLEKLQELPEECGIYYFYNDRGDIIYIGKSKNIRKRVMSHFAKLTEKARKLYQSVFDISYEVTGSELVALLYESDEIKKHHPAINRAQRAKLHPFVIHLFKNKHGYYCLQATRATLKQKKNLTVLREYAKQRSAHGALYHLATQYDLCHYYCHLDQTGKPCFQYHIKKCLGACAGQESPAAYNARVEAALGYLAIDFPENFVIVDQGRSRDERAVVLVEAGQYQGFGYISTDEAVDDIETIKEAVKPYAHNGDVTRIIRQFVYKAETKIIRF